MKIQPTKLAPHHPQSWLSTLSNKHTYYYQFNNTQHFINTVEQLSQIDDNNCKVSYTQAVIDLKLATPTMTEEEYEPIRASVKAALLKRNLISEHIYEGYEYSVEGEIIDVARYISGNPECALQPKTTGKKWFYELYINASISSYITDSNMQNKLARILATVQLLEKERIYIKINVVMSGANNTTSSDHKPNMVCVVPVFSHRDTKALSKMSAIINVRLQRKFEYAILEHVYSDTLCSSYGKAVTLPNTINLNENIDECDIAEDILDKLVIKCKKKVH